MGYFHLIIAHLYIQLAKHFHPDYSLVPTPPPAQLSITVNHTASGKLGPRNAAIPSRQL